jgi:hypothetical protein
MMDLLMNIFYDVGGSIVIQTEIDVEREEK